MPRKNVYCNQCEKNIENDKLAWFSDAEKDLDFCSKDCFLAWAEQTEVKLGFINYLKNQNPNWQEIKDQLDELKKEYYQAQIWLDFNYPKEKRKDVKKLDINKEGLEGDLDLSDFTSLETLNCSDNGLVAINLSNNKNLTEFNCSKNKLVGLDISDCSNLKILYCYDNQLTSLDLTNLKKLENLGCSSNQLNGLDLRNLTELKWLNCSKNFLTNTIYPSLNPEKLTYLNISDNNFPKQDLSVFNRFINLETLQIGTDKQERINRDIYNRFTGSLELLKNLTKLKKLDVSNTDIDASLEHLPKSTKEIYCSSQERPASRLKDLEEQLKTNSFFDFKDGKYIKNWKDIHSDFTPELQKEWEDRGFNYKTCKSWINDCQPHEVDLAVYLVKCQKYGLNKSAKTARKEYSNWKNLGLAWEVIMPWKIKGFTAEQTKEWLDIDLTSQDIDYCAWLKNSKKLTSEQVLSNGNE